jgi:hypothetical protein
MSEQHDRYPDTPLRLAAAAKIAFPDGGVTASTLRREAQRGRLVIYNIGNKQFTTLGDIERMKEKCRVDPVEPGYGSGQHSKAKTVSPAKPHGLSGTAGASAARAALLKTARELKGRSPTTSPKSTADHPANATVIRLKST